MLFRTNLRMSCAQVMLKTSHWQSFVAMRTVGNLTIAAADSFNNRLLFCCNLLSLRSFFPLSSSHLPRGHHLLRNLLQLAHLGLRFDVARRFDAAFTVRTERGKGWLLNYYATDVGLVPVQDYRSRWPHKDDCHPLSESHREAVVFDADHDRTPDILSVHVGQQFEWLRSPPKQRSRASMEHTREVDARRLRCGIVHGLGERLDEANRVLVQFEEDVQMPKSPGGQSPITVSRVPIYGPGGARARYCVLVRPLGLGLFFEVASVTPATARRRRYVRHRRGRHARSGTYGAAAARRARQQEVPRAREAAARPGWVGGVERERVRLMVKRSRMGNFGTA